MNYDYCETPIQFRDAGINSISECTIGTDILHVSVRNIKFLEQTIQTLREVLATLRKIQGLQYVKVIIDDVEFQHNLITIRTNKPEGIISVKINYSNNFWKINSIEDEDVPYIFEIENKIQELKSYYQGWYDFWTTKAGSLIEPDLKEF